MKAYKQALIILSPGFPANEADSACMPFPQLFVKTLKQLNPQLQIIVLAFQYPFVKLEYEWHHVKVIAFNGRNRGKLNRLLVWKEVWKKISNIAKEYNVLGILNFWLGECGLIGKYAAKKHKLQSFTWLLGQDARPGNRYISLIRPAEKDLIALSDFLADEFYHNYKITPGNIIPPGIDTTNQPPETIVHDIDILGAGSLIPLKRYDIFIRVVAKLSSKRPHLKTMICGDGPEKLVLQKMICDAGLSSNIILTGELDHDTVLSLMRRSKILLHPSSYEGFATVYAEALYAGARVVGFCQPMNTVFKHQHTVKTEGEMVDTVIALLEEKNTSYESVVTYPIEDCCRKILQLYGA